MGTPASKRREADNDTWPMTADGRPMVRIAMAASELIPTGQYANVTVGPAVITAHIDPQADEEFSEDELNNIERSINDIAEVLEVGVIANQRKLVHESLSEGAKAEDDKKK